MISAVEIHLPRPLVSLSFSCRNVCNNPYIWVFDSAPKSSPSIVIVPHGQAPAAIPTNMHACTLVKTFCIDWFSNTKSKFPESE